MERNKAGQFFYRMLCGAFLGISVIAPGISGSIMAVMMGIYDELISIISNPFKKFKANFTYLLPMGIGALGSILLLLRALDFLFSYYPIPAYLLFMSLIAGGIPTVLDEIDRKNVKKKHFIGSAIAFAFACTVGFLAKSEYAFGAQLLVGTTVSARIYLTVCGGIAGMMSMVPGTSISMILMMFSVYEVLLSLAIRVLTVSEWFEASWYDSVLTLCCVAVAFLVGMVAFSNVTKRVFEKHHNLGFMMVLGFMSGSVISIFPGFPSDLPNWILTLIAVAIGLSVSYLFKILGKKFRV